jgi:hypothetical protein
VSLVQAFPITLHDGCIGAGARRTPLRVGGDVGGDLAVTPPVDERDDTSGRGRHRNSGGEFPSSALQLTVGQHLRDDQRGCTHT